MMMEDEHAQEGNCNDDQAHHVGGAESLRYIQAVGPEKLHPSACDGIKQSIQEEKKTSWSRLFSYFPQYKENNDVQGQFIQLRRMKRYASQSLP